jgi:hypothetical protein
VVAAWPEPVERVSSFLRDAGAEARIEEFAEGTPTAAEAAAAVGCELDQIVKSLVLVCESGPVVALVPGDRAAISRRSRVLRDPIPHVWLPLGKSSRRRGSPRVRSLPSRFRTWRWSSSSERCSGTPSSGWDRARRPTWSASHRSSSPDSPAHVPLTSSRTRTSARNDRPCRAIITSEGLRFVWRKGALTRCKRPTRSG